VYVEILILAHLLNRPRHGYEIKKSVERVLGGSFAINNNTLYPALRRFEEMGAVRREVEYQEGKPDRNVYRLADWGVEVLQEMLKEFPPEVATDDAEFRVRVAFFELLDPTSRMEILSIRRAVLEERLGQLERAGANAGCGAGTGRQEAGRHPYVPRLMNFLGGQIRRELEWIGELAQEAHREAEGVSSS
jgi:DNA-binding PadR family transcriptional regulator